MHANTYTHNMYFKAGSRAKSQAVQNFRGVYMASQGSGHPTTARCRRKFYDLIRKRITFGD